MFGLGTTELLVIAGILFILFGAKRLPEIGKGLGGAIREFKNIGRTAKENNQRDNNPRKEKEAAQEPLLLESKIKEKVVEQIPGVKKALDVKRKAKIIKDAIDS